MTDPHALDRRPATKTELLIDFVKVRFWSIIMVASLLGALAFFLGLDPSVPRWLKLYVVTFVVLSPAGWLVGQKVISLLWSLNYIYLLDLDARYVDGALYRFPFEHFHEIEVTNGALDELTSNLYVGKNVDLEEMTVEGTWRGTLSDRELLTALNKVDQCYGQLRDDAKEGFAWKNSAFTIVYNAVRSGVTHVVSTFEEGSLPDEGDGLGEAVDDALDRYDLEQELEELTEQVDPDPAEAERDPADDLGDDLDGDPLDSTDPVEQVRDNAKVTTDD
ncbi:hypothetical protein [Halorussus halobius]|uniref:hypothetical protein n=1 Tax=Halorussus halobius TaxID=1710537 RepID=UPI001092BB2B|nr:hypothetical protein [Halorussus halobius]